MCVCVCVCEYSSYVYVFSLPICISTFIFIFSSLPIGKIETNEKMNGKTQGHRNADLMTIIFLTCLCVILSIGQHIELLLCT